MLRHGSVFDESGLCSTSKLGLGVAIHDDERDTLAAQNVGHDQARRARTYDANRSSRRSFGHLAYFRATVSAQREDQPTEPNDGCKQVGRPGIRALPGNSMVSD